jgi:putative mRNA 3-end processing factor
VDAFEVVAKPEGLHLPALGLWLDPRAPVGRAFVSHAHGDHGGLDAQGGTVLGSRETIALLDARRAVPLEGARTVGWDEWIEVRVEAAYGGGTARLSIAPAGHVLGAAQLVVEHGDRRLVYTGDYQSGGGRTHAAGAPVACDALIVESTFGLPIFRFPDRDATIDRIVHWCTTTLTDGDRPVLLGYALGKAQELVHACLSAGLPVVAHGAVHKVCAAYEALGVELGVKDRRLIPYASWVEAKEKERAKAVIVAPPQAQGQPMIRKMRGARVGYVSGWALIDAAVEQRRADAGFVLSDHADYDDLLATIAATGAKRVHVTHGDDVEVFAKLVHETLDVEAIALSLPPIDAPSEVSEVPG